MKRIIENNLRNTLDSELAGLHPSKDYLPEQRPQTRVNCLELAKQLDPTKDLSNLSNNELYAELCVWTETTQELRDARRARASQPRRRARV